MQSKLILVEGIPGSGKSTIAKRICEYLGQNGVNSKLYNEGDLNPADLSWHACVPLYEFYQILERHPQEKAAILAQTSFEEEYAIVAYTKIPTKNEALYPMFESFEVFDNRAPFEVYKKLHFKRWKTFGQKALAENEVSIFECAYFQNHVNELLLFRMVDESAIKDYMISLLDTVRELNPVILYLSQPDIAQTIEWIGNVRVNAKGEKDWLERATTYVGNSPYGKQHQLAGFDGLVACMEKRKAIERYLMQALDVKSYIIESAQRDWEKTWQQVGTILENL